MAKFLDFILPGRHQPYGGYELLEEVSKGGMSVIWKAQHPETGEIRAVKILTPESVGLIDQFRRMFDTEEGAVALRLNHPNVIRTYQYGRGRDDQYYIVMEYVDGPNLEMLVSVGSERIEGRRMQLVEQMGSGLRYIHNQGLIHRDFCPKNVLYASDGVIKIIDFGLAVPAQVKHRTAVSRAGTPSYMAPEQVRSQAVDERADIYAFGVSAFEVLTGERPFPRARTRHRRMWEHLNVEPRLLREVRPDMPEALEKVVRKCIEKDKHLRYKSMDAVMRDLRNALDTAV